MSKRTQPSATGPVSGSRRALMLGGSLGLAAAAGAAVATPAEAAVVGPWEYVAPGGSIQAAIAAGARAIQLGPGRYDLDAPVVPARGCTVRRPGWCIRGPGRPARRGRSGRVRVGSP